MVQNDLPPASKSWEEEPHQRRVFHITISLPRSSYFGGGAGTNPFVAVKLASKPNALLSHQEEFEPYPL